MQPLARVADPATLDASPRARARHRVQVEVAWLEEGADLLITVPVRLTCARCDGGGCDGCARSGVLRAPEEASLRVVSARVSPQRGDVAVTAVALRIPDPFGAEHAIGQLVLECRAGEEASAGVERLPPPPEVEGGSGAGLPPLRVHPLAVLALITLAGVLAALLSR